MGFSALPGFWTCDILRLGSVLRGFVVDRFLGKGGFGAVYRAHPLSGAGGTVAVKIFTGDPQRDDLHGRDRIRQEAHLLRRLGGRSAPGFVASGTYRRRPYVMMECLVPLDPDTNGLPARDEEIRAFARDILGDLQELHAAGWIHCDLKPGNVVRRPCDGKYLLIDFGAAHRLELDVDHIPSDSTLNERNGEYVEIGTRGYMPPETGFTVARDIFAFGHLLRDCFPLEVPLAWGIVINKCISNQVEYRYRSIREVLRDVENLDELGRVEMERRIRDWRQDRIAEQARWVGEPPLCLTASALMAKLETWRGRDARFLVGGEEVLVDLPSLGQRSLQITTPLVLRRERLLVVKGPGVLRLDLSADPCTTKTVVLLDGVTLINTSRLSPEVCALTYSIGENCYVNLRGLPASARLADASSRTSAAGNSFIRCGGPDRIADLLRDVDMPLWDDWQRSRDEYLARGRYADRPGLTHYLCETGRLFTAMGTARPNLREQLNRALGSADWCPLCRTNVPPRRALGALIGNVCGSCFDRIRPDRMDFSLLAPPCRMTADGSMTLAVMAALMAAGKNRERLVDLTVRALRIFGRLCHDEFGSLFQKWLYAEDPRPYGSWGNGAAMRVSPCAWAARSLDEALELARIVTSVTHNHPEGVKGAEAVTASVFLARQKTPLPEIRSHIRALYYPQLGFSLEDVRADYVYDNSCAGSVPQALEAAFGASSFEDALRRAISLGGDSDTLAAIAGAVAEAAFGIPSEIRRSFWRGNYVDAFRRTLLCAFSQVRVLRCSTGSEA